jgi:hypothetical protein
MPPRLTVPTARHKVPSMEAATPAPYVVSIDPGLRHAGVAVFDPAGTLLAAAVVRSTLKIDDPLCLNQDVAGRVTKFVRALVSADKRLRVVAEWPRVFGRNKSKGDPNDLLPLAGCSAAATARLRPDEAVAVRPDEWKGQAPTDTVVRARVAARLFPVEALVLGRAEALAGKTLGHNVLDAVGIGLWAVGRFDPVRAIAR